jgi:uncharacterized membrane protein
MIWLVLGVLLWAGTHSFKRIAPRVRRGMGDAGKGMVAGASILAIVLMVIGYRLADDVRLWAVPGWAVWVNNLLMLASVVLMGLGRSRSRLNGAMRHPMLTGLVLWSVAHLLVTPSVRALVLFGGLGLWGLAAMASINRAEPKWTRPARGSAAGDLRLAVASAVVFAVIVALHYWLGPPPLAGIAA